MSELGDIQAHPPTEVVPTPPDRFPRVAAAIESFNPLEQEVALLRLAARLNNGDEHFDHRMPGYSWLCHRCALEGRSVFTFLHEIGARRG